MNKSEIAERAARYKEFTEQLERNVAEVKIGINDNSPLADEKRNYISGLRGRIEERKCALELVERAIAESRGQACPKCGSIDKKDVKCLVPEHPHVYIDHDLCRDAWHQLGDGEPSSAPPGHKAICPECKSSGNTVNLEGTRLWACERCFIQWRESGAAQEVSPPSPPRKWGKFELPHSAAEHNPFWCGGDSDGDCCGDDPCWSCINYLHARALESAK